MAVSQRVAVIRGGSRDNEDISSDSKPFVLSEGCLVPLPDKHKRSCIYIQGPSGVGKSTAAERWAWAYQAVYPERDVYLISQIEDDDDYSTLPGIQRIPHTDYDLGELRMNWFRDSLIIFDDTDTISNPEQQMNVQRFKERVLETGRHTNTSVIITSHIFSNYKETRRVLNECSQYILFPKTVWPAALTRALTSYIGLTKKQIEDIKERSRSSHWCLINTTYPQHVMHEQGFFPLL